jgi:hypothetical protein
MTHVEVIADVFFDNPTKIAIGHFNLTNFPLNKFFIEQYILHTKLSNDNDRETWSDIFYSSLNMIYKAEDENSLKHVLCETFKGLNLLLTDALVSGNSKV